MAQLSDYLKDAAYVTIGFGVIAFQKAQVQRVELTKQLEAQLEEARKGFESLPTTVEDRVKLVEERINALEAQIDRVLDEVSDKLPEQTRVLVDQARTAAKDLQGQVREFVGRTPAKAA
jgi:CHASE3 domain sensor protein